MSFVATGRPCIQAIEAWDIASVDWLVNPATEQKKAEITDSTSALQEYRETLGQQIGFFKAVQSTKGNMGDPDAWGGHKWAATLRALEDSVIQGWFFLFLTVLSPDPFQSRFLDKTNQIQSNQVLCCTMGAMCPNLVWLICVLPTFSFYTVYTY